MSSSSSSFITCKLCLFSASCACTQSQYNVIFANHVNCKEQRAVEVKKVIRSTSNKNQSWAWAWHVAWVSSSILLASNSWGYHIPNVSIRVKGLAVEISLMHMQLVSWLETHRITNKKKLGSQTSRTYLRTLYGCSIIELQLYQHVVHEYVSLAPCQIIF